MAETTSNNTPPILLGEKLYLPRLWPYRLLINLSILGLIFLLASITITIKENLVGKKFADLTEDFYQYTTSLGFTISDITIEGRQKTTKEDIMQKLKLSRGDNILALDIYQIKDDLETLPWVKSAIVRRHFFSNILQISIYEREVRSIWQINNKFYPIDTEGNVIKSTFTPTKPTLLIVGEGAPENITSLLKIISDNPKIASRIKVANFISNRRWNLVLDDIENGITLKLPEDNIEQAWKKFIKLTVSHGLLKRKLTIIDLRFPNKVIVKLKKLKDSDKMQLQSKAKESRT